MYNAFFSLLRNPFGAAPDPDFLYLGRCHKRALTYLEYGIRQRGGFILLTGEVGSGKTTLIGDLIRKQHADLVLAKISNTRVTPDQLLQMINGDFGLAVAGKDKIALVRELNDFLLAQHAAGKQPVVVIDEAQNLDAQLLEEVRLLSNLESSNSKLLLIILVGQPELRSNLAEPALLQLRQRINITCHLTPLPREELVEYLVHRLTVAGNASALEFPATSLDLIYSHSRGIPRLINTLCDFIMLAAYAEESRVATTGLVREVIEDLDFDNHFWGGGAVAEAAAAPSAGKG